MHYASFLNNTFAQTVITEPCLLKVLNWKKKKKGCEILLNIA